MLNDVFHYWCDVYTDPWFYRLVKTLAMYTVVQIACGENHCLALTDGRILIRTSYLLTKESSNSVYLPKDAVVVRLWVASFSDGRLFSWGCNKYGQLGLGLSNTFQDTPQQIVSLRGIPIAQVVTGGNHSFILTRSRAVFGWGKNRYAAKLWSSWYLMNFQPEFIAIQDY